MTRLFSDKRISAILFIFLIFFVAYSSFRIALKFDFWGEDWEQIWFAVFQPSMISTPQEIAEHPIVIFEELLLAKLFLFNSLYWQVSGYLLKVLGAFAVILLTRALSGSGRAAMFAGLIFASSVAGLSSFTWAAAHSSALVIPFIAVGIYFWVIKKDLLAWLILLGGALADPARGVFGIFIVNLWDLLSFIQSRSKENKRRLLKSIIILAMAILIIKLLFGGSNDARVSPTLNANLTFILSHPFAALTNFLNNLGNLLVGWMIPIPQDLFNVSRASFAGIAAGYLFLVIEFYLLVHFFQKKHESTKILLLFSFWIVVFYLPNWLLPNNGMVEGRVLGQTHRYLTLSAVGLACLSGYILWRIKKRFLKYFLLFIVVGGNIMTSNYILKNESFYRSVDMTKPIWDKIEKDVPVGEENMAFFIRGDDLSRVISISQAKIPFALRRNIRIFDESPSSTGDPRTIKELLCGKTSDKPQVPLSHLHAWYIKGKTAENISGQMRKEFSTADCRLLN